MQFTRISKTIRSPSTRVPATSSAESGGTELPPFQFTAFQARFGRNPTAEEAELGEEDWDEIEEEEAAETGGKAVGGHQREAIKKHKSMDGEGGGRR